MGTEPESLPSPRPQRAGGAPAGGSCSLCGEVPTSPGHACILCEIQASFQFPASMSILPPSPPPAPSPDGAFVTPNDVAVAQSPQSTPGSLLVSCILWVCGNVR